jgi:uncharacterized membrane protein YgdD (TMEM256/DUF423 family)
MPLAAMGEAITRSSRFWLSAAAANGLIAVAMGAFAAHGLRDRLSSDALGWIKTASDYEMWHGLALLAIALMGRETIAGALRAAAIAFLIGIILFSGSLYLLALAGWRGFALITPLGGTALLIGWALLLWHGIAGKLRP